MKELFHEQTKDVSCFCLVDVNLMTSGALSIWSKIPKIPVRG